MNMTDDVFVSSRMTRLAAALLLTLMPHLSLGSEPNARDWSQFRGPDRDSRSAEQNVIPAGDDVRLELAWRTSLGAGGYSSLAHANGQVVTMFTGTNPVVLLSSPCSLLATKNRVSCLKWLLFHTMIRPVLSPWRSSASGSMGGSS